MESERLRNLEEIQVESLLLDAEQRSNQTNTNTTTSTKDGPMRVKLNEDSTDRRTSGEDDDMLMQRIQKYLVSITLLA
ncbi:hypothetical protein TNIN_422511 [Trichonephila inaurata madagascariensis]|uniref:Uncharacterized protein n=1 Tax=Trichonephila inaurata madagascariensis TaxID=2747483 RepID=A0A8X6XZZ9_9ARAC|nr:hypothetical protein TNIN_422511 [Trichonephila inaurata madagascariensis]